MEPDAVRNALSLARARGRHHASPPLRTLRARSLRGWQGLGRSRWRHPRGDGLLHVLRAPNALDRATTFNAARARRRKLPALLAARRRHDYRALEFSNGDSD